LRKGLGPVSGGNDVRRLLLSGDKGGGAFLLDWGRWGLGVVDAVETGMGWAR
jgi:hypothetical protein